MAVCAMSPTPSGTAGLGCKEVLIEYGNDSCKLLLWEACDSASLSSAVDSRMGLGGAPFHLTLQGADTIVPLSSALPAGLMLSLNVGKQRSVPFEIPPPEPAKPPPAVTPVLDIPSSPQRARSEDDALLLPGCADKDVSGVREDEFGGLLGPLKAASWPSTPVLRTSPKAKAPSLLPPFVALAGASAPGGLEEQTLLRPPPIGSQGPSALPSADAAPSTAGLAEALLAAQAATTAATAAAASIASSSSAPATAPVPLPLNAAPASASSSGNAGSSTLPAPPPLTVAPAIPISSCASAPASAPVRSREVEMAELLQKSGNSPAFGHDSPSEHSHQHRHQPHGLLRATHKVIQELRHHRRLAGGAMPGVAYSRVRSSPDLEDPSHPPLSREASSQLKCRIDTENVEEIAARAGPPQSAAASLKQRLLGTGLDEEGEETIFEHLDEEEFDFSGNIRSKSRQSFNSQTGQSQGYQDREISGISQGSQSGFTFAGFRSRAGSTLDGVEAVEVAVVAVEEAVKSVDRFSRLSTDLANERTLLAWIRTVMSAMKVAILMITVHGAGFLGTSDVFFSKFTMLLIMLVGTVSGIKRYDVIKRALLLPDPPQKFGRPSIFWFCYLNAICTVAAVLGLCLDVWRKN